MAIATKTVSHDEMRGLLRLLAEEEDREGVEAVGDALRLIADIEDDQKLDVAVGELARIGRVFLRMEALGEAVRRTSGGASTN